MPWNWKDYVEMIPVIGGIITAPVHAVNGEWGKMGVALGGSALDAATLGTASTVSKTAVKVGAKEVAIKVGTKVGRRVVTSAAIKTIAKESIPDNSDPTPSHSPTPPNMDPQKYGIIIVWDFQPKQFMKSGIKKTIIPSFESIKILNNSNKSKHKFEDLEFKTTNEFCFQFVLDNPLSIPDKYKAGIPGSKVEFQKFLNCFKCEVPVAGTKDKNGNNIKISMESGFNTSFDFVEKFSFGREWIITMKHKKIEKLKRLTVFGVKNNISLEFPFSVWLIDLKNNKKLVKIGSGKCIQSRTLLFNAINFIGDCLEIENKKQSQSETMPTIPKSSFANVIKFAFDEAAKYGYDLRNLEFKNVDTKFAPSLDYNQSIINKNNSNEL